MWIRNRKVRQRGMSLLEVMVALGVMVILVGGILMVVQASLRTIVLIDDYASREDEITNFVDIVRSGVRNLPPRTRMVATRTVEDGSEILLLAFRDAPEFLTWLPADEGEEMIVLLAARNNPDTGLWDIRLKRFLPSEKFPDGEFDPHALLKAGRDVRWLELTGDFHKVATRFFDESTENWSDDWKDPAVRPGLIEFLIVSEHAKNPRSETSLIWVPPVRASLASQ